MGGATIDNLALIQAYTEARLQVHDVWSVASIGSATSADQSLFSAMTAMILK